MNETLKKHHISLQSAWAGLLWAISTQPNFRVHGILSILALGLGLYLKIPKVEMIIIVFTIILGLTAEMINTSIEAMTDLITTEWHEEAKNAKDVSAGMMLTVALGAVIIAAIIFLPHMV